MKTTGITGRTIDHMIAEGVSAQITKESYTFQYNNSWAIADYSCLISLGN